ncbi:MAG TPA: MgtC/SapB family protein [Planctomycetaceae bacterium]|nr:MgtC/SapB family protein [Planctomycetaceae bacterium]
MWNDIAQTLLSEFSDLSQPTEIVRVTLRLMVAAVLGGVLGFEREHHGKSAGMRTHMLVAMGAALFVWIPQQRGLSEGELGRVLQGLIAGVGFLGAGTIVKNTSEEHVHGLTTAAGIWMTAAIGVAAGLGRESTAILSTILALIVLSTIPKISKSST